MNPNNERQASIDHARIDRVRSSLQELESWSSLKTGVNPSVIELRKRNLREQLRRLESGLAAYDQLRSGAVDTFEASRLEDLPEILKKVRLARGLTQRQFAELLGLKEQQIQRYEADSYSGISLNRLFEIVRALGVQLNLRVSVLDKQPTPLSTEAGLGSLPVREMIKRGWLSGSGRVGDRDRNAAESYLRENLGSQWTKFLNRQVIRSNSKVDEFSLLAWQARVCEKGRRAKRSIKGDFFSLGLEWVNELARLSAFDDGPVRAVDYLSNIGVIVVIEKHIQGTHLDGAASLLDDEIPIIGLTLRHDRLDNFWFVLFHELGHLSLHLNRGDITSYFDVDEGVTSTGVEAEADEFARTCLIADEKWKSSLVRFAKSPDAVISFANANGISPAIVAGRIRREKGNYAIFADLVGSGCVRRQFHA